MRVKEIAVYLSCFLWLITSAFAQDKASVQAFMNSAFQLYQNHGGGIYGKHGDDSELTKHFVHSSLQALIDKDIKTVAAAGTEEPYAGDSEIICNCQEHDGIWELHMVVKVENPKLAYVTASFEISDPKNRVKGETRIMKYTLIPEYGQWRIFDTLRLAPSPDGVSYRAGLQKDIALFSNLAIYLTPPGPTGCGFTSFTNGTGSI